MASTQTQVEGGAATKADEGIEALPPKIVEEKEEAEVVVHEGDRDDHDDDDHKDKLPADDEEKAENAEKDQIASPLIEGEPDPDADEEVEADDQLDDD